MSALYAGVMELVDVTDSKSVGSDTVWVRVPPPAPTEAGSLFELFYRKAAPLHAVPIRMTGVSKRYDKNVLLKNEKSSHKKVYPSLSFRHGFLINPMSLLFRTGLQILLEPCTPRFGGDERGYRNRYMHLHFCENPLLKNIHGDKLLPV